MQYTNASESIEVRNEGEFMHLHERNMAMVDKGLAALDVGDHETSDECMRQMYRSAEDLLAIKHIQGADWIREMRFDTTPAEKEYGRDWLDKDI